MAKGRADKEGGRVTESLERDPIRRTTYRLWAVALARKRVREKA